MTVTHKFVVITTILLFSSAFCFGKKCEKIRIPMCQSIGYNLTYMPNMFNHDTQEEATLEIHQFWPLVEIKCSPDLKFFLCFMYAPKCQPNNTDEAPPCRSICERARNCCGPLMRQYGFAWPKRMECKNFPELGGNKSCMDRNETETSQTSPTMCPPETTPSLKVTAKGHRISSMLVLWYFVLSILHLFVCIMS